MFLGYCELNDECASLNVDELLSWSRLQISSRSSQLTVLKSAQGSPRTGVRRRRRMLEPFVRIFPDNEGGASKRSFPARYTFRCTRGCSFRRLLCNALTTYS